MVRSDHSALLRAVCDAHHETHREPSSPGGAGLEVSRRERTRLSPGRSNAGRDFCVARCSSMDPRTRRARRHGADRRAGHRSAGSGNRSPTGGHRYRAGVAAHPQIANGCRRARVPPGRPWRLRRPRRSDSGAWAACRPWAGPPVGKQITPLGSRRQRGQSSTNTLTRMSPMPTSAAPAIRPAQIGSCDSTQTFCPVEPGRLP